MPVMCHKSSSNLKIDIFTGQEGYVISSRKCAFNVTVDNYLGGGGGVKFQN